eukprot:5182825-Prymnesium_polylepis.2
MMSLSDALGGSTKGDLSLMVVLPSSLNCAADAVASTRTNGAATAIENSSGAVDGLVRMSGRVYDGCSLGCVEATLNLSLERSERSSPGVSVSPARRSFMSGCLSEWAPDGSSWPC